MIFGFGKRRRSISDKAKQSDAQDRPLPEFLTYVVGDIHGRADLLEAILTQIDTHVGNAGLTNPQLVFVGDYIDHGPDSAEVLARLQELCRDLPDNVTCLLGSHERMLLDFLSDPVTRGPRWMKRGAGATLESFGLHTIDLTDHSSAQSFRDLAAELRDHLTAELILWLETRPLSWNSGNLWAVHAGADPYHPMSRQSPRVLLWGHPEFEVNARPDGAWVAHGHTRLDQPRETQGRIAVDTGAWQTGRLTAAAITPDGKCQFLST